MSHRICTGVSRGRLGGLIAELAPAWLAQQESRLRERRGRDRLRAEGAGPRRDLVFSDRVVATLVVLRFQLPHGALAVFYGVDRSTITRAVGEIRPLLAARGFAVPGTPGVRLHSLADVFAYAASEGVRLRIDGTEVQVRRPQANRPGRRAFRGQRPVQLVPVFRLRHRRSDHSAREQLLDQALSAQLAEQVLPEPRPGRRLRQQAGRVRVPPLPTALTSGNGGRGRKNDGKLGGQRSSC